MLEKVCFLAHFYHWTPDYIMCGITGAQGWIYYAWGKANESSFWGGKTEVVGGYHSAEVRKILKARKKK